MKQHENKNEGKGPVHTNRDIFENGGIFSHIRKPPFSSVHAASKNTRLKNSAVWKAPVLTFGYQKHRLRDVDGSRVRSRSKKALFSKKN